MRHVIFQERTYAVLIVSASEKLDTQMRALLPATDYYPVLSARSVGQARRMLLETPFPRTIIRSRAPGASGRHGGCYWRSPLIWC